MSAVGMLTGGLLLVGFAGPALADSGVAEAPTTAAVKAATAQPAKAAAQATEAQAAKAATAAKAEQARVAANKKIPDRVLGPGAFVPVSCRSVAQPQAYDRCVTRYQAAQQAEAAKAAAAKAAADKAAADKAAADKAAADRAAAEKAAPAVAAAGDSSTGTDQGSDQGTDQGTDQGAGQGAGAPAGPVVGEDPPIDVPECAPGADRCNPQLKCEGGDNAPDDPLSCGDPNGNGGGGQDPAGDECTDGAPGCVNGYCTDGDHSSSPELCDDPVDPPTGDQECTPGSTGCDLQGQCENGDNTPDDSTTCDAPDDGGTGDPGDGGDPGTGDPGTGDPGTGDPGNGGTDPTPNPTGPTAGGTDPVDGSSPQGTVPGAVLGTKTVGTTACGSGSDCQSLQAVETSSPSDSELASGLGDTGASTMLEPMLIVGVGLLFSGLLLVRPRRIVARHRA